MKRSIDSAALVFFLLCGCASARQLRESGVATTSYPRGRWELADIPVDPLTSRKLFPQKKPYLVFDSSGTRFSGNTGCNSISGLLDINGSKIKFKEPMIMTKMACLNGMDGEQLFLNTLKGIDNYITNDSLLVLRKGARVLMKFAKR